MILNFEQVSMLRTLLQSLRASSLSEGAFLIKFVFQPQIIRNHRDKFGICGVDEISFLRYNEGEGNLLEVLGCFSRVALSSDCLLLFNTTYTLISNYPQSLR